MSEPVLERVRVALTDEDKITRGTMLARHLAETERLEAAFAAERKAFAEQMKERSQRAAQLAEDIALGSEVREVACIERVRLSERLVEIVRCDTREVVRVRALQPDERQTEMFDADADAGEGVARESKTKH